MFDRIILQRLYRYSYALTANEPAAHDLLQDGLERFLKTTVPSDTAVEPFIRKILRNRFIDQLRRQQRIAFDVYDDSQSDSAVAMDLNTLEDVVMAKQEFTQVWEKLEAIDREILYYWAVEGYTAREVAELLQMPRGTILSRIHRLRNKMERPSADAVQSGEVS